MRCASPVRTRNALMMLLPTLCFLGLLATSWAVQDEGKFVYLTGCEPSSNDGIPPEEAESCKLAFRYLIESSVGRDPADQQPDRRLPESDITSYVLPTVHVAGLCSVSLESTTPQTQAENLMRSAHVAVEKSELERAFEKTIDQCSSQSHSLVGFSTLPSYGRPTHGLQLKISRTILVSAEEQSKQNELTRPRTASEKPASAKPPPLRFNIKSSICNKYPEPLRTRGPGKSDCEMALDYMWATRVNSFLFSRYNFPDRDKERNQKSRSYAPTGPPGKAYGRQHYGLPLLWEYKQCVIWLDTENVTMTKISQEFPPSGDYGEMKWSIVREVVTGLIKECTARHSGQSVPRGLVELSAEGVKHKRTLKVGIRGHTPPLENDEVIHPSGFVTKERNKDICKGNYGWFTTTQAQSNCVQAWRNLLHPKNTAREKEFYEPGTVSSRVHECVIAASGLVSDSEDEALSLVYEHGAKILETCTLDQNLGGRLTVGGSWTITIHTGHDEPEDSLVADTSKVSLDISGQTYAEAQKDERWKRLPLVPLKSSGRGQDSQSA